jgi:hypothetical protein
MSWTLGITLALVVLLCIYVFQQPNPGKTVVQLITGFIFEFIFQIALAVPVLLVLFMIFFSMKGCIR